MTTILPRVSVGFLALLLGALSFATTAEAASKRIGVPKFDGTQEALVRKKVMQVLKAHGYDLAKSREMEIGLANTGALLDNDEGFAKVAKELALSAIVTGEVGKKRAKISVHDGRDGSLLGDANFSGANPRKIMAEVGRDFWKKLGGDIARGKTPSGAKKPTKVVAEAPEDNEDTQEAPSGGGSEAPPPESKKSQGEPVAAEGGGESEEAPRKKKKKKKKMKLDGEGADVVQEEGGPEVVPSTFDFYAGPSFINRSLAYHQDASMPGLRPYSLGAGPAVVASVMWFPMGPFTDGPLKHLGIEGHIEQAFLVSSSLPPMNGVVQKFGTSIHEFSGGVRYRIPFGTSGHYFHVSGTGGEHAFTFKSTDTGDRSTLDIPDTIYRYLRPGVGVHFELPAQISLGIAAGYRYIFNGGGQFKDVFFPQSTVAGIDAQAMAGYRINDMFEARVVLDFRRYFSTMNCAATVNGMLVNRCDETSPAHPGRNFTAGGAVDQYFSGSVVLAITMGGTETASAEAEEAPPPPKRKRKIESEDEEPPLGDDVNKGDKGGGDE